MYLCSIAIRLPENRTLKEKYVAMSKRETAINCAAGGLSLLCALWVALHAEHGSWLPAYLLGQAYFSFLLFGGLAAGLADDFAGKAAPRYLAARCGCIVLSALPAAALYAWLDNWGMVVQFASCLLLFYGLNMVCYYGLMRIFR